MGGERMKNAGTSEPRIDLIGGIGLLFLLGAVAVLVARCQIIPPDEPPKPPAPVLDAAPEACEAACANLTRMRCEWAEPTPGQDDIVGTEDDGQCVDVCRAAEGSPETTLNPSCIAAAGSCEEAEGCVR
jgi:hypothetical protein